MDTPPNLFFETVKNKIYPWLIPIPWDPAVDTRSPITLTNTREPAPFRIKWFGKLGVQFVADMGDSWRLISPGDTSPGITYSALLDLSINNLAANIEFKSARVKFGGYTIIAPKDHVAESILVPHLWQHLTDYHNDNLVVAAPNREHVFFIKESDKSIIGEFGYVVNELFQQSEYPLSKMIMRVAKNTLQWDILEELP